MQLLEFKFDKPNSNYIYKCFKKYFKNLLILKILIFKISKNNIINIIFLFK